MILSTAIDQSEQLAGWLGSKIDGLEIPNADRCRLAAGCLDMVFEHQTAVILLTRNQIYGSAAALIRLLFESYVRGVWLLFCASEQDINRFKKDKLKKSFDEIIREIEKIDGYSEGVLSDVKEKSWKAMNSFTHTGFYQVVRRNTDIEISSDYSESEILDALSSANSFAILAGVEVANMAKNEPLTREIVARGSQYFETAL